MAPAEPDRSSSCYARQPLPVTPRDLVDYADRYGALPFEDTQVAFRRRAVLEVVRSSGARRILEVGCGLDPLACHLDAFDTWTIVEPAPRFAEAARRLTEGDLRVTVVEATIEHATSRGMLAKGMHDLVLLSSLLHELPDPAEVLRAVRALADDNTLVHANVPNAGSFHRELAVAMQIIPSVDTPSPQQMTLQQLRIFDHDTLRQLAEECGFTVVEHGGYFLKPFTHAQMQGMLDGGTIDRPLLEGLYQLGKKFPSLASEIFVNLRRR